MICCQSAKSYDQKHGHGAFSNSLLCFTVCIAIKRHFECRSFIETFTIDKKALT